MFCDGCGLPTVQSKPTQPTQSISHEQMAASYEYGRLGGWLLVWVILASIAVFLNIGTAMSGLSEFIEDRVFFMEINVFYPLIIAQLLILAAAAFIVTSIVQVFLRNHRFLFFYQLAQLLLLAALILGAFVPTIILGTNLFESAFLAEATKGLVQIAGGFFLWALYFSKSERVRTYMGDTEYMEKAIFAFRDRY